MIGWPKELNIIALTYVQLPGPVTSYIARINTLQENQTPVPKKKIILAYMNMSNVPMFLEYKEPGVLQWNENQIPVNKGKGEETTSSIRNIKLQK